MMKYYWNKKDSVLGDTGLKFGDEISPALAEKISLKDFIKSGDVVQLEDEVEFNQEVVNDNDNKQAEYIKSLEQQIIDLEKELKADVKKQELKDLKKQVAELEKQVLELEKQKEELANLAPKGE